MSAIPPRLRKRAEELKRMNELKQESSLFDFRADQPDYPDRYEIVYHCWGLAYKPDISGPLPRDWRQKSYPWLRRQHEASIYLPVEYPDQPPRVILKQPVFHPNITSMQENQQKLDLMVRQAGGQEAFASLLEARPELREELAQGLQLYVCVDGIVPPIMGGNYHRGIHIRDICVELGHMIMFQRYNLDHGLNQECIEWTRWAEKQENLLPVDSRELLNQRPVVVQLLGADDEEIIVIEEPS